MRQFRRKKMPLPLKYKRLSSVFLFSLNVGSVCAALWAGSQLFPFFIVRWIISLNLFFGGHAHGSIGGDIVCVGLALVAGLPAFWLYARLAGYKPRAATILLGMTAIGSAPLYWIAGRIMGEAQWSRWLLVEASLAVLWTVLVVVRGALFSTWSRIIIIILHFGFWAWKCADTDMPIMSFSVLFISAAAAMSWAFALSDKYSMGSLVRGHSETNGTFSVI
jgi:hypothetical protein